MERILLLLTTLSFVETNIKERTRREFVITEDQPIGTYVGRLSTQTTSSQFVQHGRLQDFKTDKYGVLNTRQVIDREKLTQDEKVNGLQFYVLQNQDTNITVVVKVRDVNDNFPVFPKPVHYVAIDSKVGSSAKLINAVDSDSSENAFVTYSIVNPGDFPGRHFELENVTVRGVANLYIRLKYPLNVGKLLGRLILNVSACDVQLRDKCSYLTLNMSVAKPNTHTPRFLMKSYSAEVLENATIGHVFLRVKALDADPGLNGEIEYSMWGIDRFSIHPRSGDVYVRKKLDAEVRVSYTLVVIAKDKGKPPKRKDVHISVTVLDCNDNPPKVSVAFLHGQDYNVIEGVSIGSKIAVLSVSDIDKDKANNQVILKLLNTDGYFRLQKDGLSYSLLVNKTIDRELTPNFTLKIYASDNGVPPLYSQVEVPLKVGDINDNVPIFVKDLYKVSVNESTSVGHKLLQVVAQDPDLGKNGLISYHITHSSVKKWFGIHKDSGVLYIADTLDREKQSSVWLKLSATDNGDPTQLSSTCSVQITILDANDNYPYFKSLVLAMNITENNKPPSLIGK